MKKISLLLLGILSSLLLKATEEDILYFSGLSLKDGLSQMSVLKICQDSRGFMWFGTRNGLNKYDGENFTVYRHINNDSTSISDNHITALLEDSRGNLWVGTVNGLNRINLKNGEIRTYYQKEASLSLADNNIVCLYEDHKNRLWVGTSNGISLYIPEYETFQRIDLNGFLNKITVNVITQDEQNRFLIGTSTKGLVVCSEEMRYVKHFDDMSSSPLTSNSIITIYQDSKKQIWIGTQFHGINQIDINEEKVIQYTKKNSKLLDNNIRCFIEQNGKLMIGTFAGLCILDLDSYQFSKYKSYNLQEGSLSHFSVYSLYIDKAGTLWVGTYAGGVNYYNPYNRRFVFYDPVNETNSLFGIYGMMVCNEDLLWIATEGGGLLEMNIKTKKFSQYLLDKEAEIINNKNIIKSLKLEGDKLWCGTNDGLIYHFDIHTKKFKLYHQIQYGGGIYFMHQDSLNNLWLGTTDNYGLICISSDSKEHFTFKLSDTTETYYSNLRCILELRKGVYLIGTRNSGIFYLDNNQNKYYGINTENDAPYRLNNNYVSCIIRDSFGRIWIGTFGGGIHQYDEERGIIKTVTTENKLTDDNICAIIESNSYKLWISTSDGISKYNPENGEIVNYKSPAEIQVREFTPNGSVKFPNGEIFFSGNNGLLSFYPATLNRNDYLPPVFFKDISINNRVISPGDETGILSSTLDNTEEIILKHNQNNFSISYGALNYIYTEQNTYTYRLVGYDKDWIHAGNRKEAFYTNLNPGEYIFEVKAANNDGIWNEEPKKLYIMIKSSIWTTPLAYLSYSLVLVIIVLLISYYRRVKRKLEQDLNIKNFEKQKLEEFHQTQVRMFTNFSHELRTPLILIINPLEHLLKKIDLTPPIRQSITLINVNAQRLLSLVNQLMDLRKNQSGKMELKISNEDLYPFVQEIYYAFKQVAESKQIDFTFNTAKKKMYGWFDRTLIEKVIFNLLSNALKYSEEGASVSLQVELIKREKLYTEFSTKLDKLGNYEVYAYFEVRDTGRGIPEEEMEHIFTPFYQVYDKEQKDNIIGTGIGLSLAQSIVLLHGGIIWVENNQPKGTRFRVLIPVEKAFYKEEQIKNITEVIAGTVKKEELFIPENSVNKKYKILLVEDNKEIREYMKTYFDNYYHVLEASNGVKGFDKTLDEFPDIIISDVMMPKMDGLEFCSLVKQDVRTSHIPIVLLTAKSMMAHIKEGYQAGADDYVVKPFRIDLLHCRIQNLLKQREKLKELYGKKFTVEAMGVDVTSGEERFMQKFYDIIEKNISNPDLNVDMLCNKIGLSRTNLYRKLKPITDLSPTELIRNKRMEIAVKLLESADMSVSEISTFVGFNSHAYFSNSFKSHYGVTPKEYVKKQNPIEI